MARKKDDRNSKRREAQEPPPPELSYISGKLVIVAIVVLAVAAAGFSWWYRYTSTHRAAAFWGPDAVALIRDAPVAYWIALGPMDDGTPHEHDPNSPLADHYHTMGGTWRVVERREITKAPGLTHLRNELLMDRAFQPDLGLTPPDGNWQTGIEFRVPTSPPLVIFFTADFGRLLRHPPKTQANLALTSSTLANGLKTVFAEWRDLQQKAAGSAAPAPQSAR